MTIKLYTFRFSPPARLAHLVAKIIEVDHQQVEVDLSKVMMMVVMVMNIPVICHSLYASAIFRTLNCTPKSA